MPQRDTYLQMAKYVDQFAHLNAHVTNGKIAPHKPIMLLTVISLIESGEIWENAIYPSDKLRTVFEALWNHYVPQDSKYAIAPWTPYWHLRNEPFWHFKLRPGVETIDNLVAPGQTASLSKIKDHTEFAYLDNDLYLLLKNGENRSLFKRLLIESYL